VKATLPFKFLICCALLSWLLAAMTGAHGHFCFDGQEAPISVHLAMTGEHIDHHADEQHLDMDVDISQSVLIKLVKIELPVLVVAILLLFLSINPTLSFSFYSVRYFPCITNLLPPSRAPPLFPA